MKGCWRCRYHGPLPTLHGASINAKEKSHVPGWINSPAALFVLDGQSAIWNETLCNTLQFTRSLNEELNGTTSQFDACLLITISQPCA